MFVCIFKFKWCLSRDQSQWSLRIRRLLLATPNPDNWLGFCGRGNNPTYWNMFTTLIQVQKSVLKSLNQLLKVFFIGETIIKRDFFGFYRIRTDQKNRVLLTKDFNDIKNCIEIDANLMVDCFNLSDPDLAKVVVQAEKCSISVDFTNFLTISGNNKKRFRYSLRHDLARFEDEGTEEGNLPCEGDYIRSSMDSWIQEASNPGLLW